MPPDPETGDHERTLREVAEQAGHDAIIEQSYCTDRRGAVEEDYPGCGGLLTVGVDGQQGMASCELCGLIYVRVNGEWRRRQIRERTGIVEN